MATISPDGTRAGAATNVSDTSGIGGHPRGLTTLFLTEMWERFSYYGLRPLLVLFMSAGSVLSVKALAIVSIYMACGA